jgi:hypothetical protein
MAPNAAAAASISRRDQRSSGCGRPSAASGETLKAGHCNPPVQPSNTRVATAEPSENSGTWSSGTGENAPRSAIADGGRTAAIVVSWITLGPMAPSSCRVRDGEIVLPSSKAHVLPPKPSSSLSAGHSASDSMSSQDARVIEEDRPVGTGRRPRLRHVARACGGRDARAAHF